MEFIDIVDENGSPTGETIDRGLAHRTGTRHRTAHVWIVRKKAGKIEILLQKRAKQKDSFPGCYDISSAGHIPAGVNYIDSAIRELKEELGIQIDESELTDCGLHCTFQRNEFHGIPYVDNQVAKVLLLWKDKEPEEMILQEEEVEAVVWMDFEQCKEAVRAQTMPTCIDLAELERIEEYM